MKKSAKKRAYLKKVGINIRKARKDKGLSQESLAFSAELDRSYIGGVERGERNISIVNLKKIADALNIQVNQLLKDI